jgi:hypothetical protein
MKINVKHLLLVAFLFIAASSLAQKDSMSLVCPFEHGTGREPKEAFTWDPPDQKVIMISHTDSIIRSCINGEVVKVINNEDSAYEVVIFAKGFYFWYNNIAKPLVQVRQIVKARQSIGRYKFDTELEFRMYKEMKKDEPQMMDPRNWLDCKVPKGTE